MTAKAEMSDFERHFRNAWADAQGDDFASRMARRGLVATAVQVAELRPVLEELNSPYRSAMPTAVEALEELHELLRPHVDAAILATIEHQIAKYRNAELDRAGYYAGVSDNDFLAMKPSSQSSTESN
jgi:hypothetical protein